MHHRDPESRRCEPRGRPSVQACRRRYDVASLASASDQAQPELKGASSSWHLKRFVELRASPTTTSCPCESLKRLIVPCVPCGEWISGAQPRMLEKGAVDRDFGLLTRGDLARRRRPMIALHRPIAISTSGRLPRPLKTCHSIQPPKAVKSIYVGIYEIIFPITHELFTRIFAMSRTKKDII